MEVKYSKIFGGDVRLVVPEVHRDLRGFFYESYREDWFKQNVSCVDFVQENCSRSHKDTVRGLHFQEEPYAQSKLVECTEGFLIDIILDIREDSPTFGCYETFELNEDNHHQLFIPKGFAHGFFTLSDRATLRYKCDNYYCPEAERGIQIKSVYREIAFRKDLTLSKKDSLWPTWEEFTQNLKHLE